MMLSRSAIPSKAVRYALSALMLAAVLGLLSLQQSTQASGYGLRGAGAHSRSTGQSAALVGAQLIAPLRSVVPGLPIWSANVRANTDMTGYGQHEPGLAVSPANPNVVVITTKDYRDLDLKRVWIMVSRDGGQTWPTQLHMPDLPPTDSESDPVAVARDDGRIYVSCLTTGNHGIFITWTDDGGLTWQPSVPVVQNAASIQDKDWFAIDNNPTSPYYHRVYMTWAPGGVVSSHSTDGGSTWSAPVQIPNTGPEAIEYPYPVVAPNGDVFMFHMYNWTARTPDTSILKVVKSTDGGVSWSQPVDVSTVYQPPTPRFYDYWRFFSIISAAADPTDNNRLYTAWTDNRNDGTDGTDVVYSASTDHGATWGPVTRLSHDPTGLVRDHITPMLTFSSDGRLHALWLDRRLDPANELFQAWYSSSTDDGVTWEADTQVSDVPGLGFNLSVGLPPGSNNAAGDYWGLEAVGGYVYAAWNDTRNGDQDIYTSRASQPLLPTATPTATATATSTPTPTPALVGHVTWQGRPAQPNALQQLPITLTLKLGTQEFNYPSQTTDARGTFTVSVSGLPAGTYNWRVKGPRFLANAGTLALGLTTNAEMGLMRVGDCDNDNAVTATDFILLRLSFGKTLGEPGYDDRADLNGDHVVNTSDFILLKSNFGLSGAPPIGP